MKLSIVVPCFNESKNLYLILERFNSVIKTKDIEVILVNNGSTDNSKEILTEIISKYYFARVVDIKENKGYGFGIVTGLKESLGEFIGFTHADMQTDPNDVIKAYNLIRKEKCFKNCYVKGNRKGRPFFDQIFTICMSIFETVYLKQKLWDINAQPNIFHKSFFNSLIEFPNDFSLDLFLLFSAKKKRLKLIRFNVLFPSRVYGESKWNTGIYSKIKFIKRTLSFSYRLKKML